MLTEVRQHEKYGAEGNTSALYYISCIAVKKYKKIQSREESPFNVSIRDYRVSFGRAGGTKCRGGGRE